MSVWQNRVNSYISHTAFNDRKKGLMISADGLQYTDLRALKLELYIIPNIKNTRQLMLQRHAFQQFMQTKN